MKFSNKLLIGVLILSTSCANSRNLREEAKLVRSFNDIDDDADRLQKMNTVFRRSLLKYSSSKENQQLDNDSLKSLFEAISIISFYSKDWAHIRKLEPILDEMSTRKLPITAQVQDLHSRYIMVRRFDKAKNLAEKFPVSGLETLPTVEGLELKTSKSKKLYEVSADGKTIVLQKISFMNGAKIVAITSPFCSPSKRSLRDIRSDSELGRVFEKNTLLLIPPKGYLALDGIAEWNAKNPNLKFSLAHDAVGWTGVDDWTSTPVFYFFKDGERKAKIHGWPPEGKMDKMRQALRKIGAL